MMSQNVYEKGFCMCHYTRIDVLLWLYNYYVGLRIFKKFRLFNIMFCRFSESGSVERIKLIGRVIIVSKLIASSLIILVIFLWLNKIWQEKLS